MSTARQKLHESILDTIKARSTWEERQANFYEMRHRGLRRKAKPFPGASDLHWPLIDTHIEKLKPVFFRQIVGMDTVASFVPMKTQLAEYTTTAEQWFDFKIRERSNLQEVALSWIDFALMAGRGLMKVDWDFDKKRLKFDAIPTLNSIVPAYTRTFDDADWWVHVIPLSKDAYIRDGRYLADKETLDKIVTSNEGNAEESGRNKEEQVRRLREGITHSSTENRIIVWEVYRRTASKRVIVLTYSPQAPNLDLREQKELPFDHQMFPGIDFCYEVTDGGWYSPRGVPDKLAPFEITLTNTWNHKHDAMAFFARPMFRAEREMPNTANLRVNPGTILPYGLAPVPMQQSPVMFDEEMNMTRAAASELIANPDFGMTSEQNQGDRKTAAEIKAISAENMQSGDLRARMLRMSLARLYKMAWKLLIQYDKEDLQYRFREDVMALNPDALHDMYEIEPKGGLNEVNRSTKVNEAIAIKQLLAQSPFWDQSVLEKNIINLQEPSLIKTAFQDPNTQKINESESEMLGIPALLIGAPLPVKTGQDYVTRIGVLMQFLQNAKQTGQQLPPAGMQAIVMRLGGLVQALTEQDNNGGKQLGLKVQEFLQAAGFMAGPPGSAPPAPAQPEPPPAPPPPPPAKKEIVFVRDANGTPIGAKEI